MKRGCNRRQQIRTLFISSAGIAWCAFVAGAAQEPYDIDLNELRRPPVRQEQRPPQEPYDIDLKELRRPPVRRVKGQRPPRGPKESGSAMGENSSYTVQPGDHLFLILMKHYGLTNEAAEQLIPEIVRLNGIRKPKSLSVGQRLTIPLPPVTKTPSQSSHRESHRTSQPESADVQPHAIDSPNERDVVALLSQPCPLAREVAEQLGVRVSALSPFLDTDSISVSYGNLKMAVVCGLAPAEAYTLKRLLARHGVKLLAFNGDEAPRTVVEGLAGGLGISFRLSNEDAAAGLPLTYLFPAVSAGKDLKLTIRPVVPSSK